jgi:stage III sporulation protein AB
MLFKLVGGILVIFSCTIIGFTVAGLYQQRPKILRNLQTALSMLETEINYGRSPLPEAMKSISGRCEKEVADLFLKTTKYLSAREGYTAGEAWEKALKDFSFNAGLRDGDIEILSAFGKYLGASDRDDQVRNIKLALESLRQQEMTAIEEKRKNERLWKYLGVLTGLMVFLLLY